ncbi:hypothetical protein DOTSEDRAFT_180645 [Dothistroma septosporum NZE10]|uniref:Secreted protein n=1 Tax=Dothistroma septosporum (strain NZE10 / CBS 128990) TaxID=675120 RepID=M2WID9_DOTSN|nr:hypothetical protein DOTSEDRAFT_180645 [Dothistroma septosporum NZE10]
MLWVWSGQEAGLDVRIVSFVLWMFCFLQTSTDPRNDRCDRRYTTQTCTFRWRHDDNALLRWSARTPRATRTIAHPSLTSTANRFLQRLRSAGSACLRRRHLHAFAFAQSALAAACSNLRLPFGYFPAARSSIPRGIDNARLHHILASIFHSDIVDFWASTSALILLVQI